MFSQSVYTGLQLRTHGRYTYQQGWLLQVLAFAPTTVIDVVLRIAISNTLFSYTQTVESPCDWHLMLHLELAVLEHLHLPSIG